MRVVDLGLISHGEAEALQKQTLLEVLDGGEETLFLLEHPPTITFGRNGGEEFLLAGADSLRTSGIAVVPTSRGGSITCHFPGQLVGYPVMRLSGRPGGLRGFFSDLEEAVIRVCAHFGVSAGRREGFPGVWTGGTRKICSIGIGVKKWVSYHGFALNVGPDLSLFSRITLCGLPDAEPTSLSRELNTDAIPMQEVKDVCAEQFRTLCAHSTLA